MCTNKAPVKKNLESTFRDNRKIAFVLSLSVMGREGESQRRGREEEEIKKQGGKEERPEEKKGGGKENEPIVSEKNVELFEVSKGTNVVWTENK